MVFCPIHGLGSSSKLKFLGKKVWVLCNVNIDTTHKIDGNVGLNPQLERWPSPCISTGYLVRSPEPAF